jgi:subtilisin family serine protease
VAFAAPGVDVKVAVDDGRYRAETGTSMAAPYAAAIIAGSLAAKARAPEDVLAQLKATAIDLGEKAFDDVYGFGLISSGDPQ